MEEDNFVGNLGAKECIRAFGVGGESSGTTKLSEVGEETDMDIMGSFMRTVSPGGVLDISAAAEGKDWIMGLGGIALWVEEEGCKVALLLLLLRYSCILCWKEMSTVE